MPHYRIRTSGAVGGGEVAGIGISGFEIQDMQSMLIQSYGFAGIGLTVGPPVSGTVLSSWTEFDANCGLGDFGGWVLITDASLANKSKSEMRWSAGPAMGTKIDTSGWEISIPGGSTLSGGMTKIGDPVKVQDTGREDRWVTLAIWHPLLRKGQRWTKYRQWATYWARLDLNMYGLGGLAPGSGKTWEWAWVPQSPPKHMPVELMGTQRGANFCFDGGVGRIRGTLNIDLVGIEPAVLTDKLEVKENAMYKLLDGSPDSADNNGIVNGGQASYDIVWMLTAFKLNAR